tara:strand:- start:28604 stop:29755 length:1152 start_codon:yes stop_codon:yes gene_type:complete
MKVLLDVSSVALPLSGIGRYALELAHHLPAQPGVDEVLYLRDGRVVATLPVPQNVEPAKSSRWRNYLKALLPYRWLLRPYRKKKQRRLGASLAAYRDYVLQSPNFSIPPVAGRSVVTIHDLSVFHFPQFHPPDRVRYLRDEITFSVHAADAVVTDSEFVREELLQLFQLPEAKVTAVPLGVSSLFKPRPTSQTGEVLARYGLRGANYILSVGTIEPRKNIDALLDAYMKLSDTLRKCHPLVIVGGSGWNNAKVMARLAQMHASRQLIYLSYVNESDLPHIYSGATVFCYPSFYEGFGLPVIEAMASGIPVVCSNASSLPEVCGGVASQFDPYNARAIAAALQGALEDSAWRSEAAALGVDHVQRYRWDATAKAMLTIYEGLPQ